MIDVQRTGALCVLLGLLLATGCQSSSTDAGSVKPDEASPSNGNRIEAFASRLPDLVADRAQRDARAAPFETAQQNLAKDLHNGEAVSALYGEDEHRRLFVVRGDLTEAGTTAHTALSDAGKQALDPKRYHIGQIDALLQQLSEQAAKLRAQANAIPEITGGQRGAIEDALQGTGDDATQEVTDKAMLDALLGSASGAAFNDWLTTYQKGLESVADKSVELEVLIADGLLRYALDVRLSNTHDVPEDDKAEGDAAIVQARQMGFFRELREKARTETPRDAIETQLGGLVPIHYSEQYQRLQKALAHYEAIARDGGWPVKPLPRIKTPKRKDIMRLKPGLKRYQDDVVLKTKKRLAGEKLYDGPIDNIWDEAFTEAVKRYRRNNQLADKAWIDYEMVKAMQVPVEFRIAQIKINLQRMRESHVAGGNYYVHVNIPEYFAEVWDGGKRAMRFRVVVGSRRKYRDKKTGEFRFPDATPLMTEKMEKLIFNPWWTVPPRIRAELKRSAKDDPDYWERNNYEFIPLGNGEMIRQKPGKGNALGQVKFLFPNDEDIYMHDTPRKDLFRSDVRAFSHGCMRVHNPLEFAHYLLAREDPNMTPRRVRINANSGQQFQHNLKDGPTIYLDYITVKVDDEGETLFFWDIYHRDIALAKERYEVEVKPTPHYP